MKIIVVEDEGFIADGIADCLKDLGHEVLEIFYDADSILKYLSDGEKLPDLVFMDITLEGSSMDGVHCARALRQQHSIPCVFMTADGSLNTTSKALLSDIDPIDYINKPAAEGNIYKAMILADKVLRNTKPTNAKSDNKIVVGEYTFDLDTQVIKEGPNQSILEIHGDYKKLLVLLFENLGGISKESIATHIWGEDLENTDKLRAKMTNLRKKLANLVIINENGMYYLKEDTLLPQKVNLPSR